MAVAFHNPGATAQSITVDFSTIPGHQWKGATLNVRDMWSHTELGTATGNYTVQNVPSHGSRLIRFTQ